MKLDEVIKALEKHGSKRGAIVELGYTRNNSCALKKLYKIIDDNNLHHYLTFKNNGRRGINWSEDNLKKVIPDAQTYTDVLHAIGSSPRSYNFKTLKQKIEKYGIDTSHFNRYKKHYTSPEDVFVVSKKILSATVKRKLLDIVPYKCNKCGIFEWMGEKICLEMDHINGISFDHRLDNLRLLCPNCHSQTPTHNRGADKKTRLKFSKITEK